MGESMTDDMIDTPCPFGCGRMLWLPSDAKVTGCGGPDGKHDWERGEDSHPSDVVNAPGNTSDLEVKLVNEPTLLERILLIEKQLGALQRDTESNVKSYDERIARLEARQTIYDEVRKEDGLYMKDMAEKTSLLEEMFQSQDEALEVLHDRCGVSSDVLDRLDRLEDRVGMHTTNDEPVLTALMYTESGAPMWVSGRTYHVTSEDLDKIGQTDYATPDEIKDMVQNIGKRVPTNAEVQREIYMGNPPEEPAALPPVVMAVIAMANKLLEERSDGAGYEDEWEEDDAVMEAFDDAMEDGTIGQREPSEVEKKLDRLLTEAARLEELSVDTELAWKEWRKEVGLDRVDE